MQLRCLSPASGLIVTNANMLWKRCVSITERITSGLGRLGLRLFTIGQATARMLSGILRWVSEKAEAILERLNGKP